MLHRTATDSMRQEKYIFISQLLKWKYWNEWPFLWKALLALLLHSSLTRCFLERVKDEQKSKGKVKVKVCWYVCRYKRYVVLLEQFHKVRVTIYDTIWLTKIKSYTSTYWWVGILGLGGLVFCMWDMWCVRWCKTLNPILICISIISYL
jgi:hypothetical protein